MTTRQKKDVNLEKKETIQKDFTLVEKVLNGEPLDTRTVLSKKLKALITATEHYAENRWDVGCIILYRFYSISQKATPLLCEYTKKQLRDAANLYKKAGKTNNLFFQNYLNTIKNQHS